MGRTRIVVNAAIGYMVKAGLLEKLAPKRYRLTSRGREEIDQGLDRLSIEYLRTVPEFEQFIQGRYHGIRPVANEDSPVDLMRQAYNAYKHDLIDDIRQQLEQCSWLFIERLVTDLLVSMGYGDPHELHQLKHGPGDEGIDGVIKEDRLGLDLICIQAKHWQKPVGRPDVQKFIGSLESARAKKGVFITTSSFTSEASEYVSNIEKHVVLIDGQHLAELMIDYDVGVSAVQSFVLKRVDTDYFEENK